MTQARYVEVTYRVPGLSAQQDTYDQLSANDMACWHANTRPPAMQLSIRPRDEMGMISSKEEMDRLRDAAEKGRQLAKDMRKPK